MNNPQQKLKIVYMGTPDFAVPSLENLIANPRLGVVAVYTQPPRPAGRGQQLRLSPVHELAGRYNIPVRTPKSFRKDPEAVREFAAWEADIGIVAAYGLILPKGVLDAPRYGCLNIHASLLPRWRGAAPIQRAIEAGDKETGITIMQMDEGLDTGPMIEKRTLLIHGTTTAQSLHDELSALGSAMIEDVLETILDGKTPHIEMQNDSLSCYAPMLKKEEGHIDFQRPAAEIDRKIRAFTPWPGCWILDENGKRFKILEGRLAEGQAVGSCGELVSAEGDIICDRGSLYRITSIQPESGKRMTVADAVNGGRIKIGQSFR